MIHAQSTIRCVAAMLWMASLALAQVQAPDPDQSAAGDPPTLLLTWLDDPCTTMTAQWLVGKSWRASTDETTGQVVKEAPTLRYAPADEEEWRELVGTRHAFGPSEFEVCRITMTGLDAGATYRLRIGKSDITHSFRTAPSTVNGGVSFVTGGDVSASPAMVAVCQQAAKRDPLFALIGGDIAYANGVNPRLWVMYLSLWREHMVTAEGRLIPMLAAIGNHETNLRVSALAVASEPADLTTGAPFYSALFALSPDQRARVTHDFGDYLSLVLLDSGHTEPVAGVQVEWMEKTLGERAKRPHLLACYHVPSLPSHRPHAGAISAAVREHWWPLFDKHGVDVAYENHDHTYKRSPLIHGGESAPTGTLYLGDGCWGVAPRPVKASSSCKWYFETTANRNHFIHTTLWPDRRAHAAIDREGAMFDCYPAPQVLARIEGEVQQQLGRSFLGTGTRVGARFTLGAESAYPTAIQSLAGKLQLTRVDAREAEKSFDLSLQGEEPQAVDLGKGLDPGRYKMSLTGTVTLAGGTAEPFALPEIVTFDLFDLTARPPVEVEGLAPGLGMKCYIGEWTKLPDFTGLETAWSGSVPGPGTTFLNVHDLFALTFDGWLKVPTTGLYELATVSDDGSRLWIGDQLIVDNDGLHGAREKNGLAMLEAGFHPLRIHYFERTGSQGLQVVITGPGLAKQMVPADMLWHRAEGF